MLTMGHRVLSVVYSGPLQYSSTYDVAVCINPRRSWAPGKQELEILRAGIAPSCSTTILSISIIPLVCVDQLNTTIFGLLLP